MTMPWQEGIPKDRGLYLCRTTEGFGGRYQQGRWS
jgi:hypothetical protein